MHMPPPSAQETAQAIELGHEPSTVSVRGVAWFFAVFFVFGAVVHVIIWVMYQQLVKYVESQNVQRTAIVMPKVEKPTFPLLQPSMGRHEQTEVDDMMRTLGTENIEFVNRGWINKETGEFRIPDELVQQVAASGGAATGGGPTTNPSSGGAGGGMPR
jgi:hypothetical protein